MTEGHGLWNMDKRDGTIGDKTYGLWNMDKRDGTIGDCRAWTVEHGKEG